MPLKRYSEWSPTAFDPKGLALENRQAWLVCPVSITRDTDEGSLAYSNFVSVGKALDEIDPSGRDHEAHRFGHWGPGWFEIWIVRPNTECAKEAEELADALENYPVLDEEDFSRREFEAMSEAWAGMSVRERVALLQEQGKMGRISIFAARRDELPRDDQGFLTERLVTQ